LWRGGGTSLFGETTRLRTHDPLQEGRDDSFSPEPPVTQASVTVEYTQKVASFGKKSLLIWMVFLANNLWFYLFFHGTAYTAPLAAFASIPAERLVLSLAIGVSSAALVVFERIVRKHNRILMPALSILLLLGSGMYVISGYQSLLPQDMFAVIGSLITGVCWTWFYLSGFRLFRHYGTLWEIVLLLVSQTAIANLLLVLILVYLPETGRIVVMLEAIVANGVFLWFAQRSLQIDDEPRILKFRDEFAASRDLLRYSRPNRMQLILLVAVSFATVIMRMIGISDLWGEVDPTSGFDGPLFFSVAVSVGLLYGALSLGLYYFCTHRKDAFWLQLPFFVLLAGLIVLQFLSSNFLESPVFIIVMQAFEWLLGLVYVCTIVNVMRSMRLSTFRVTGIMLTATSALTLLWLCFFADTNPAIGLITLGVLYLITLFISLKSGSDPVSAVPTSKGAGLADAIAGSDSTLPHGLNLEARIAAVAHQRNLTKRETEILRLLVQGRSLSAVCEELVIAQATVRAHIRHIYEKLEVHSRQELMSRFL
jgi:DNA-binding CsgD family transcriptional regulator